MTTTVNIHEAKTHLSRLLSRVQDGEEIIIARAGKPLARLTPLSNRERGMREPGLAKGRITRAFFEPLSAEEQDAWEI